MVPDSTSPAAERRIRLAGIARLTRSLRRPGFFLCLTGGLMLLSLLLGQRLSERADMDQLAALAIERLEPSAANPSSELGTWAADAGLQALLDKPANTELRRLTSQALARVNLRAGTHDMLVVDAQGRMLASSWPAAGCCIRCGTSSTPSARWCSSSTWRCWRPPEWAWACGGWRCRISTR